MKNQIQLYGIADHNDRVVVAATEETMTADQVLAWYHQQVPNIEVPEGKAIALVPEEHGWFITSDGQGTLGPNNSFDAIRRECDSFEGDSIEPETVLMTEREVDLDRRAKRIAKQKELAEYMAKFE